MSGRRAGICAALLLLLFAAGCARDAETAGNRQGAEDAARSGLRYAEQFSVKYLADGTAAVTIENEGDFLLVPEGADVPDDRTGTVIPVPVTGIYLADSAAMDLFASIDALSAVRMTSTKQADWSLPQIREEMDRENILYAGKYSAPDYELLLEEGAQLAIENTMIHHSPAVKEQLEALGIPVMVARASYETHPLGRLEWIRLYGLLTGKQEEASAFFDEQEALVQAVLAQEMTEKTVAFFYVSANGYVNVRRPNDYVPRMIALAGARYVFDDLKTTENDRRSTMNMQQETFYAGARDADILIYNATIDGGMDTVAALLEKGGWLADFKAVQNGNVWCTELNLFQQTSGVAGVIEDIHTIVADEAGETDTLHYLHRLR